MSNPNPNPATRWKPGQSGNPKGRDPGVILSKDEIRRVFTKYLQMPKEELEKVIKDKKAPTLDHMIASSIQSCIEAGEFHKLDGLLSRIIGKVKEELEVSTPKPYVIETTNGNHIEMGAQIIEAERELLEESDHEN
jgi:hypothetical protein